MLSFKRTHPQYVYCITIPARGDLQLVLFCNIDSEFASLFKNCAGTSDLKILLEQHGIEISIIELRRHSRNLKADYFPWNQPKEDSRNRRNWFTT